MKTRLIFSGGGEVIYALIGMPLAGKTTWGRELAGRLKVDRFCTGDFARSLGMGNEPSIEKADLSLRLDGEITDAALAFCARGSGVLDGFPRSATQYSLMDCGRTGGSWDYRIVFVTANPVVIYERLAKRRLELGRPEDLDETVAGRVRASVSWRSELKSMAGSRFFELDESEGFESLWKAVSCVNS